MRSNIEIAQSANLRPIVEVAAELGLAEDELELFGKYKAKVTWAAIERARASERGKLILVTGMTPTPRGEGKTTLTVGLGQALWRLGRRAVVCVREPSLGPCFGIKGGGCGGGLAQVVPMADINLHFTGDMHAIAAAHNLLAAMLDAHIHWGNELGLDVRRIIWPRVLDMCDRPLREVVIGLGGPSNGVPRQSSFQITAASEVMAILSLARGLEDLKQRLGRIVVGFTTGGRPVRAADLRATGAMALLLYDALRPNLVQTLEGTPAFVHGGPFGNIAHGCSSVLATELALGLGEFCVTEAGFGSDLGAEKFFNIKCRQAGLTPHACVVVASVRALRRAGGAPAEELDKPDVEAVSRGTENLLAHVENVKQFGVPVVVALNRFAWDTEEELAAARAAVEGCARQCIVADPYGRGGEGVLELAEAVAALAENDGSAFRLLYPDEMPLAEKIRTIARRVYGAEGVEFSPRARGQLAQLEDHGLGELQVCMAKTQFSLSDDKRLLGRPRGFRITVREVYPSAGAGFVVALTGEIMTMPGLGRTPAAIGMDIEQGGKITGLF